jgi:hypothetical protein
VMELVTLLVLVERYDSSYFLLLAVEEDDLLLSLCSC